MKNAIKGILINVIIIILLVGCGNSPKEKNVQVFIKNLISTETYKDISIKEDRGNFIEDCKLAFGDQLTKNAFDLLLANRIFSTYQNVLTENKVSGLKISKISKKKYQGHIHIEYEVSYKLEGNNSISDMKDYMEFDVLDDKSYIIDKVSISNKRSSIFQKYKEIN